MPEIRRILCPVDFSDDSRHAIDHAVVIARWYEASITALHAYDPLFLPVPGVVTMAGASLPGEDEITRIRELATASFAPQSTPALPSMSGLSSGRRRRKSWPVPARFLPI
jgi:nucleotide-binding universal stress UspA family protein